MVHGPPQMEFVLPVVESDLPFLHRLLSSLAQYCPPTQLNIIVPAKHDLIREAVYEHIPSWPVKFVPEETIWRVPGQGGWFYQQVLKLGIAKQIKTDFYLVLDADVVLIRPLRMDDLIVRDHALFQLRDPAVTHPMEQKWAENAARFWGTEASLVPGVTPAVLSTKVVQNMIKEVGLSVLEKEINRLSSPTSEYSLYYFYLQKNNLFSRYHVTGRLIGPSVWKIEDFMEWSLDEARSDNKPFVVLQSRTGIAPSLLHLAFDPGTDPVYVVGDITPQLHPVIKVKNEEEIPFGSLYVVTHRGDWYHPLYLSALVRGPYGLASWLVCDGKDIALSEDNVDSCVRRMGVNEEIGLLADAWSCLLHVHRVPYCRSRSVLSLIGSLDKFSL